VIDFPSSPTNGQVYDKWTWNGSVWALTAGDRGGAGFTFSQDTVPIATKKGDTWFQTSTGDSFVWVDDGSSTQWVQFGPGRKFSAAQIAFTPTSPVAPIPAISATNVQAAIEEVAVDTAANYARGIEVVAPNLVYSGTAVGAGATLTVTNTISFTPRVGRRYRLFYRIRAITGSSYVYLTCIGTNIAANDIYNFVGGAYIHHDIEIIFDGTGVASTYYIRIFCAAACNIYSGDQPVSKFYIEDVGPAR
jgi:hypothetical protein